MRISSSLPANISTRVTSPPRSTQLSHCPDDVVLSSASLSQAPRAPQLRLALQTLPPSPETMALLGLRPELAATLMGLQPTCPLKVSSQQQADVEALAHGMTLIGDQRLEVVADPANPGTLLLINISAVTGGLVGAGILEAWSQTPQSIHSNSWGPEALKSMLSGSTPLRTVVDSGQVGPSVQPEAIRQVGLIAYCDSQESLTKFQATLRDWDQNFATFEHRDCVLRICDDSAAEFGSQVRSFVENYSSPAGTRFEYLGRVEKEAIRQKMIEAILESPKRSGETRQEIDAMTLGMFGGMRTDGSYAGGPTQNRNLSTLLMQGARGFQADHDMQPRIKTASGTLAVDLLAQLAAEPADKIASPQFSGCVDPAIISVLNHLPAPEAVVEKPKYGVRRTASPMLLPAHYPEQGFLPIAPPVRDGDIMVGRLMSMHGGPDPQELVRSILHTEAAGSKWGGEAPLLRDTLVSDSLQSTLNELRSNVLRDAVTTDATAEALLNLDKSLISRSVAVQLEAYRENLGDSPVMREVDAEPLQDTLTQEVGLHLQHYGLALKFRDEILAITGEKA